MKTVFISGSIRIKKIHSIVLYRIENIIKSSFNIIIGDAGGVDSSIQNFLKSKSYEKVVVYCSGQYVRNNVGLWPVQRILTEEKEMSKKFYTEKDIEMANKCDFGLMVWNSMSTGTLTNVIRLLIQRKKSLVFLNKSREFIKVKSILDFECLVSKMSDSAFEKANKKISLKKKMAGLRQERLFEE